ncbi:hypothetical protein [Endozoicomonas sp. 4G]|uniref:hypothetical protein n=1 Tax=Endozoicomonas sp. 4G TaxID=2872754 RepID=UPI0020787B4D|nr:hypothetical protein [Endozoicomonas sp. 4G]
MKLTISFLTSLLLFYSFSLFADSFTFDNPDEYEIKVYDGDVKIFDNHNKNIYFGRNPTSNYFIVRVDNFPTPINLVLNTSLNERFYHGCNYHFSLSKKDGWAFGGGSFPCSKGQDHLKGDAPLFTVLNDSSDPSDPTQKGVDVYPAIAAVKDGFTADNKRGFLFPGDSRPITEDNIVLINLGIKPGSNIQIGFFNPYTPGYIACGDDVMPFDGKYTFTLTKDKKCVIKKNTTE